MIDLSSEAVVDESGREWCELQPGVSLLISSAANPDYRTREGMLDASYQRVQDTSHSGTAELNITDDNIEALKRIDHLRMMAVAEHLVHDWEGIVEKGVEVEYTPQRCVRLFRAHPKLFNDARMHGWRIAARVRFDKDELSGKSNGSSNGEKLPDQQKSSDGSDNS